MAALVAPGAPLSVLIDYGLGDKLLERLLESGVVTVEKLGSMTPEQLEEIQGIGPKMVERIQEAVNNYFGQFEPAPEGEAGYAPGEEAEEIEAAPAPEGEEAQPDEAEPEAVEAFPDAGAELAEQQGTGALHDKDTFPAGAPEEEISEAESAGLTAEENPETAPPESDTINGQGSDSHSGPEERETEER
jgi:N utilization substance protein A